MRGRTEPESRTSGRVQSDPDPESGSVRRQRRGEGQTRRVKGRQKD